MGRKTTVRIFQATNWRNFTQGERDGSEGRPEEWNWISSNGSTKQRHKKVVKAKIDNTQQKSKCRLGGDRDETIDHNATI